MTVNGYKIGRYHAILKKTYADGSVDYETQFSDADDIAESYCCIRQLVGEQVGTGTDDPKVLTGVTLIRGTEEIKKELETPDAIREGNL